MVCSRCWNLYFFLSSAFLILLRAFRFSAFAATCGWLIASVRMGSRSCSAFFCSASRSSIRTKVESIPPDHNTRDIVFLGVMSL